MWRVAQSAIFAIAGVAGLLVIAAFCAPLLGFSLVRLETGSMSPGYPAGSILLVRDAPASELSVGDIVTVQRAGHSPVTHRIVTVEPAGSGAQLILQGDANAGADPEPYLVDRVGLHLAGVPFGGGVIAALASPIGLIAMCVFASLVVLWAWWPQPETPRYTPQHRRRGFLISTRTRTEART